MSLFDNPVLKNLAFNKAKKFMHESNYTHLVIHFDDKGELQLDGYSFDIIAEQQKTILSLQKELLKK